MKRVAVMTSGGDAPGMNAAIRAVVRTAIGHNIEVYGIQQGYAGLLTGDMKPISSRDVSGILQRGGTILQTARNDEFKTPQGQRRGLRSLNAKDIQGLVVIGGDGSLRGGLTLHKLGIPIVGVPASIDNDIWGTNMCIGVDTALNTILDALDRLRDTATSHTRAFVIEVMGRNSGYLALMGSILGGAEVVITPERAPTMDEVAAQMGDAYTRGKSHAIAVIAEGAPYRVMDLAAFLNQQRLGFEIRVSILGHIQRGGSPSAFDRLLATRLGTAAINELLAGNSGVMMGLEGTDIIPVPIEEATSKQRSVAENYFDMAWTLSR